MPDARGHRCPHADLGRGRGADGCRGVGSVETIAPDGTVARRSDGVASSGSGSVGSRSASVGAIVVPPGSASASGSAAGVIGANVMQRGVWQLDVPAGRLTIAGQRRRSRPHRWRHQSARSGPPSPSSPSPMVDIGVGRRRLPFLVDTGSEGGLAAGASDLAGLGIGARSRRHLSGCPSPRGAVAGRPWSRRSLTRLTLGDGPPRWRVVLATDAAGPRHGHHGHRTSSPTSCSPSTGHRDALPRPASSGTAG